MYIVEVAQKQGRAMLGKSERRFCLIRHCSLDAERQVAA